MATNSKNHKSRSIGKELKDNLSELQKFKDIALCSGDFLWEINKEGRYTYASAGVEKILGYSPEEIIEKTPFHFMPKNEQERIKKKIYLIQKKRKKIYDLANWNIAKDGKKVCLLTNGIPIYDEKGNFSGYRGIDKDITNSILSELSLNIERHKLNDIIDFLPDATFVIDSNKKVIAWNKAIEKMTGVKKEEILGKGNYEYSLPFYGKRRPILIDLVFMSDIKLKRKYDFIKKEGNTIYGEVFVPKTYRGKGAYLWGSASLLFDENGKTTGAIESIRDISERKKAEKNITQWKERYDLVAAASGQIAYECNVKEGTILWSNTIKNVLGYKISEMNKGFKQWKKLILPKDRRRALKQFSLAEKKRMPYDVEYRFKHKKGHYLLMHDKGYFLKTGRELVIIGMMMDVTEQRKSQNLLKESEKKY
ncbi:MAG: PAS domain S-box protein [archaeon]